MKKLLWIEQNQYVSQAIQEVLEHANKEFVATIETTFVNSFASAKEKLENAFHMASPYDFYVIDPTMISPADDAFVHSLDSLKIIFYTHENAVEFMPLVEKYKVMHVILKELPFDGSQMVKQLRRCLFPEHFASVWGLIPSAGSEVHVVKHLVRNSDEIYEVMGRIEGLLENTLSLEARLEICTPLVEAITNAVYHAPKKQGSAEDKYIKGEKIDVLNDDEVVEVSVSTNDDWVAVGIKDFQGTLNAYKILEGITKNFTDESLYDENGRGFFLMYCMMDELQITIQPNKYCEITLLKSRHPVKEDPANKNTLFSVHDESGIRNKPLIINVV